MSGGALTEYRHDLFRMEEWAEKVRPVNPVFAQQLLDTMTLLEAYDRYLSGDTGKTAMTKAWDTYTARWYSNVPNTIREILTEEMTRMIDGALEGCHDE